MGNGKQIMDFLDGDSGVGYILLNRSEICMAL